MQIYSTIGEEGFTRLVHAFYSRVKADDLLGPMYPANDFENAERRLRAFLIQRFGGPTTYSDERGHPKLRMRHMPFTIGPLQRDHWLTHMSAAVAECSPSQEIADTLMAYFVPAAEQMRNDTGLPISSARPRQ